MNFIILMCLIILLIVMVAMLRGRAQATQRIGAIGIILVLTIGGASLYGFLRAAEYAEQQFEEKYVLAMGSVYSYMEELESNEEIYSFNSDEALKEASTVVNDALPAVEDQEDGYLAVDLVKSDDTGNYYESYEDGQDKNLWDSTKEVAKNLIAKSVTNQGCAVAKLSDDNFLLAVTDNTRVSPSYAMLVKISSKPLRDSLESLKLQYAVLSVFFLAAGMALATVVVKLQEREIKKYIRLVTQVAEGKKDWTSFKVDYKPILRESTEMHTLQSAIRQIASNIDWMNYSKYKMLQAYYRFAPKQIEKILHRETIMEVGPLDRVDTEATLAFVSFSEDEDLTEKEYLRQMVENYSNLGEVRKEQDGIIIAGSSDLSTVKLMFNKETKRALEFGTRLVMKESMDDVAGDAFVLLHRTSFVYGVAGDEEQAFTYVHSNEMKVLDRYINDLRNMGVRMVVTDYVHEVVGDDVATRYIGYIESAEYTFKLYEVLDAYSVSERKRRVELMPKFKKALGLFYQSDFYLARNTFSEILKSCPTDEVAKWYLFICENCLNNQDVNQQSFAIFSQK